MFGWKKKKKKEEPKLDLSSSNQKIEVLNKNIDLNKLTSEIKKFLKKSDDPFNYNTYILHDFPDNKLKVFKIDFGFKRPTIKSVIVIEGDENNLRIYDHVPGNYAVLAEFAISDLGMVYKYVNYKTFKNKLWQHLEDTVKSLENNS